MSTFIPLTVFTLIDPNYEGAKNESIARVGQCNCTVTSFAIFVDCT